MDKIAVLIPCYNEAQTVGKVVHDWKQALPDATIYVYDNNSTDGTGNLAAETGAVVRPEYRQGKGNVVRRMFREIDAECYIMTDGDDTYPAECGPALAEAVLEHQADMVVGDRLSSTYFEENKRPFHNLGNALVRSCINNMFHTDIRDIMTGCRAFSFRFVKTFPVLTEGFEIETEMSIHTVDKNMALEQIPIAYRDRPEGSESKLSTFTDGLKVLRTIARLYRNYRPLQFFGLFALVLALLSVAFFLPVFAEYLRTGLVLRFPTLIVSGFTMLAAILSFFSGLILHTMKQKEGAQFEFRLHIAEQWFRRLKNRE